ncbi:MAG TPA: response regulator [Isosphaeraceae bacterium]|jgi:two-component system cell cycle response regulator|nr:response regulator [Isosphaeraceae bacterium]
MAGRILVIEDNAPNLELMTYLLKAFGYTTLEALDGDQGLEIAWRERPDLIICDLQLPTIDGYAVAQQLKSDPAYGAIPVVVVTAFAMVGDREKVLAAGFDGYISKPIAPETFISQVELFVRPELRGVLSLQPHLTTTEPDDLTSVPASKERGTILAVDNLPSNLSVLRSTFEPLGYEVITTASVFEALEVLSQSVPDLILSDMQMPLQTGHDLLLAVRSDPRLCSIPFIILTSSYWSRQQMQALDANSVSRLIIRPIDPESLIAEVEACLRERFKGKHGHDPCH